jgi:septal ring factor EnvC (AmiA/AmiB activator)
MAWFNSIETLSKLIPIAQILIVILTIFTIWATVHRGNLEKLEKAKLAEEIAQTKSVTGDLTKKNTDLEAELKKSKTELTKKNIDLESELKESKTKLSDLKKKTEARSLLPEQKTKLAQLLPAPATFQVAAACRLMDNESTE